MKNINITVEIGEAAVRKTLTLYGTENTPTIWATAPNSEYALSFTEKAGRNTSLNLKDDNISNSESSLLDEMERLLDVYYEEQDIEIEEEVAVSEIIKNPYNADDIRVRSTTFTLEAIYNKISDNDIDLNPDFQRHFVWDKKRKSRLIESILLGIPLPVFYFAQNKEGIYSVVDGIQRLNTIYDYMSNKFALANLEHLKEYDGLYYTNKDNIKVDKALPQFLKRRVKDTDIMVNIIESGSPDKLKYDIFRRINEGGKPLNQQEIRNSLAKKEVRQLLKQLAYSEEFANATQGKQNPDKTYTPGLNDTRMVAQEIVLRYAGFYIEQRQNELRYKHRPKDPLKYMGDMNDYLDATLDHLKALRLEELDLLKNNFLRTLSNCYHLFGKGCFRKCELIYFNEDMELIRKPLINKALFTIWTNVLTEYEENFVRQFPVNVLLIEQAKELGKNAAFLRNLTNRTTDRKVLESLFESATKLAERVLVK